MSPKILVIRLSSLGDVVLTGPVYKSLKAYWPACRVTVLVKPQFAAALQAAQGGPAPVLIRIETKAGHGAGKPTAKIIDEQTDRWAFVVRNLQMTLPLPRP